MPRLNLGERVGADDEEEFIVRRHFSAHLAYGVDRVAARRALFEPRDTKPRIADGGQFGHADAVLVRRAGAVLLVRGTRGRNKQDAIQVETIGCFASYGKMRLMD